MRRSISCMIIGLAIAFGAAEPAAAGEIVVAQKNRQFVIDDRKVETVTIKPGDTIAFRNDDKFAHNVSSRTAGQEFDIGMMKPGEAGTRSFAKAGTTEVECAMHPGMKVKVLVEP